MNPSETEELRSLAEAYVAGELTPGQKAALEGRLRGSEEARLCFLAFLEVHAGLAWEYRGADAELPQTTGRVAPPMRVVHGGVAALRWKVVNLRWALPLAAAVMLLLGLALMWLPEGSPRSAIVKASLHGQWMDGNEVTVGSHLSPGVWDLQNGLVEIETDSGTTLMVQAPARIELVDALHARLMKGNVVVRMPKGKSGFVVELPQMRVTDLGTEFGVSAAPDGESRVQVFDGKVRAESLIISGRKELGVGESVVCNVDGVLSPEKPRENRFVRRFPPRSPADQPGGALYSRSAVDAVRVTPPVAPVAIDADLSEWNRTNSFRSACLSPYSDSYYVEGMMMYDAQHLYIAAHVGDPEPMRNSASDSMDFAGGSVIVRLSTDRKLGWPLKGTTKNVLSNDPKHQPLPESLSERVVSLILSHDAQSDEPRIRLQYGFRFRNESQPLGWRGAFRKDADGRGYTLEYAIPWRLLHCEKDPPRPGDVMAALWMVHWSDADGRLCRGQLVEVTNPQARSKPDVTPPSFFTDGSTWGRAVYLPSK